MNDKSSITYRLTWDNIEIEIVHSPSYIRSFERVYGHSMDHLQVKSVDPERAPLPITETGYKSIWIIGPRLEEFGGPEQYIRDYLTHEAKSPDWLARKASADQYSLF